MLALQPDPVQPSEGNDSHVIVLAFGRKTTDGGKARIRARREHHYPSVLVSFDNLAMDHVDPALPYIAPDGDCA